MQFMADFFRGFQLPRCIFGPAQAFRHSPGHTGHIKHRMALKNLRQTIGQVADQTFAGPLAQFKGQLRLGGRYIPADQPDVVGPFLGAAEQGVKKIIGPLSRKNFIQKSLIKRCHGSIHSC